MPSRPSGRQRSAGAPAVSLVLAFDCAVNGLGIAVVRDGARLAGLIESGRDQAARLLPAVEAVLREARIGRRDLSLIAVTVGPGSFTGVRVGLAAARGLAVGLGVPLAGVATTSVLLAQTMPRDRLVVAAIDSRLGDWFCAIVEDGQAPFVASADELASRLGGKACLIVGAGAQELTSRLVAAGLDVVAEEALPDPVILARIALDAGIETWRARNAREGLPRPLYLRGVNITLPDGARRTVE
jgi:tRNA threonylcarbamoyladenosine biosynthesis protein TsaB